MRILPDLQHHNAALDTVTQYALLAGFGKTLFTMNLKVSPQRLADVQINKPRPVPSSRPKEAMMTSKRSSITHTDIGRFMHSQSPHLCGGAAKALEVLQAPVQGLPGVLVARGVVCDHEELCGCVHACQQAPLGVPIVVHGCVPAGVPDVVHQLCALLHHGAHVRRAGLDRQRLRPRVCTAKARTTQHASFCRVKEAAAEQRNYARDAWTCMRHCQRLGWRAKCARTSRITELAVADL